VLRAAMHADADRTDPLHRSLSQREFDVLVRLEQYLDKEIAWDLSLSYDGVRYRVRSIFAKLGARGRLDAVHRRRRLRNPAASRGHVGDAPGAI